MNINDINEEFVVPDTFMGIWKDIFDKQRSLAEKYKEIENMGDLLETTKNNPDTAKGQKWIKDFAWRVTEELAEAYEASEYEQSALQVGDHERAHEANQHFKEELADSLHFLVELTIIAGYDEKIVFDLSDQVVNTHGSFWEIVFNLGLLCNTLKNKPWKQTQMLTDRANFEKYLRSTWKAMIDVLLTLVGDYGVIYAFYFKKNKVNQFRQKSNY